MCSWPMCPLGKAPGPQGSPQHSPVGNSFQLLRTPQTSQRATVKQVLEAWVRTPALAVWPQANGSDSAFGFPSHHCASSPPPAKSQHTVQAEPHGLQADHALLQGQMQRGPFYSITALGSGGLQAAAAAMVTARPPEAQVIFPSQPLQGLTWLLREHKQQGYIDSEETNLARGWRGEPAGAARGRAQPNTQEVLLGTHRAQA